ncbi:hypothetical protein BVI2075_1060003 [Burkholderia vietnamiensis]|nr:hypothetical protein BVI2075_1060003 [Burkholderia vietnamiensis]
MQRMRRLDQHDRPAGRAREHGRKQPQLPDSRLRREQFDQRTGRPAAAGQLCRKHRMTGVDAPRAWARQLRGAPQARMDLLGMGEGGVHGSYVG